MSNYDMDEIERQRKRERKSRGIIPEDEPVEAALTIELPDKVMAWRKALYNNVTISQIVDENRDAVSSWLISKTESA